MRFLAGSGNLISGVTVDGVTNVLGFSASQILLTSDGAGGQLVELNIQDLLFTPGSNVTVDVATDVATKVPEPTSLALFGLSTLTGAVYCGWRRRKQPAQA